MMKKVLLIVALLVAGVGASQAQTVLAEGIYLVDPATGFRLTLAPGSLSANQTFEFPAAGGKFLVQPTAAPTVGQYLRVANVVGAGSYEVTLEWANIPTVYAITAADNIAGGADDFVTIPVDPNSTYLVEARFSFRTDNANSDPEWRIIASPASPPNPTYNLGYSVTSGNTGSTLAGLADNENWININITNNTNPPPDKPTVLVNGTIETKAAQNSIRLEFRWNTGGGAQGDVRLIAGAFIKVTKL